MSKLLTYSELTTYPSYADRLRYLKSIDLSHESPRGISNAFYKNRMWLLARKEVIARDYGMDLGIEGMFIDGRIIVHHMNPLTPEDLEDWNDAMYDPELLISVSEDTHNQIHYNKKVMNDPVVRKPGDTRLW